MSMSRILLAVILLAIVAAVMAGPIARGIENFKTFLSLLVLLDHCDGAGSPPPCH